MNIGIGIGIDVNMNEFKSSIIFYLCDELDYRITDENGNYIIF